MIPDSFKTPEMIESELKATIADEKARIERSQSGVNEYLGFESSGQADSAKRIKEAEARLAEAESQKLSKNGAVGSVTVDKSSNPTYYGGAPAPMILGIPAPLGGERPDKKS
jgi:hypothetical protein